MIRAALYVRVSAKEQTVANQELELRRWAERRGLEIAKVYAETASGARGDRVALAAVLAGAHRREFDVLLIWSLDRLSREGIGPMVRYMDQLRTTGVRVQSHQEAWVDTSSPVWDLLLAVFAWVAQQERCRLEAGEGWRQIARAMKAPVRTLRRRWKEWQKSPDELSPRHEPLTRDSYEAEGDATG
jgi:DNA invertase Pin-like site-specific DNA recombinase